MNTLNNLWRYARLVSRTHGKSLPRQAAEILRLRFGPQRIGLTEYYEFELFDDSLFDTNHRNRFIGNRYGVYLDHVLNDAAWYATSHDKIVNYQILAHLGFRIPPPIATYNRFGRRIGNEPVLEDIDSLLLFLNRTKPYPFFIKPIHGYCGVASFGIQSIETCTRVVELINGESIPLDALTREILYEPHGGMLLQSVLRPPAAVAEVFGERLSTFRIVVLLTESGPMIHFVIWKLARYHNMTDNFSYGVNGNMQGWLDPDTGTLERVIKAFWPHNQEILDHPDTGGRMQGYVVPGWDQVRDAVLAAAVHFPGIKLQSWDVALCEEGPVLVELNTNGNVEIPQLIGRKPFLNSSARGILPNGRTNSPGAP